MDESIDVTIVGGGMITNDLILPTVYHLQRTGAVNSIKICALNSTPLLELKNNPALSDSFPGQSFTPYPPFDEPEVNKDPDLFKEVLAEMKPRQAAIIALPDQLHYGAVKEALLNNQHVLCVKPLVLKYEQSVELEKLAFDRGLFIGVEYHKRFDRRSLLSRKEYRQGRFGEFIIGEAQMIEPYYYRFSNFQNWFTTDKTDPFVYVGCHYVDLVYFITGLKPVAVSVEGVVRKFPNGNKGFMWSFGRVRFENDALLNVTDGLGYPDDGAGSNDQGLKMYCEGEGKTGLILHNDQYRGMAYSYLEGIGPGGTNFNYINPDFFRMVPWDGPGYKPIGYGPESVSGILDTIQRIENETAQLTGNNALARRRELIKEVDERGLIATPANSYINELVTEAARASILNEGELVKIEYGAKPHIIRKK
ncbi:MAG: Gfo/Idh/MocA family oxidoreductase [Candidatus Latescibacteria bacterium]|nr:Gfo/Idh/MocA family oxidoreductase [Candidatus Latescibacterota bacterium]